MHRPIVGRRRARARRAACAAAVLLAAVLGGSVAQAAATPRVHAIVGARLVTAPGVVVPYGTLVMRDGLIVAVGPASTTAIPADARVWPGDSLTVYAGLIDPFVLPPAPAEPDPAAGGARGRGRETPQTEPAKGLVHQIPSVHPESRVVTSLPLGDEQVEDLRAAGFAVVQVAPRSGIFRGSSAVVGLGEGRAHDDLVREDAAQVVALEPQASGYPGSLMGAIAVIRQGFLDARWYRDARAAYAKAPLKSARPETNLAWDALQPAIARQQPVLFVGDDMLQTLRAGALAAEAGVAAAIVGDGDEYKRAADIAALRLPLIEPVNFPEAPDVANPDDALEISTEELRAWQYAPGNPGRLAQAGAVFSLTSNGLKDVKQFRGNVGKAIARGWSAEDALAAVTVRPAQLLGVDDRLGTLAPGKIASLTVTRGELFAEKSRVREIWVDGDRYEVADPADKSATGSYHIEWTAGGGARLAGVIIAADKDTTVKVLVAEDTLTATAVRLDGPHATFTVVLRSGAVATFDMRVKNDNITGTATVGTATSSLTGGRRAEGDDLRAEARGWPASRPRGGAGRRGAAGGGPGGTAGGGREAGMPEGGRPGEMPSPDARDRGARAAAVAKPESLVTTPIVMGQSEAWSMPQPPQPAAVLVRNAMLWTAGPQGNIERGDLLVRNGVIVAVGGSIAAPAGAVVIDATGKAVAPGIIDCHSHSAVLGNVNECTNAITAEVRIGDVINSESINIYRQLASGATVMHLLHGSCNAIGGQCAVIRNKWGLPPDKLLFAEAPPTIKFALGENPKQSNFGLDRTGRYPQSRAGVEQTIGDGFTRARDYRAAFADYRAGKRALPPARDLQLDALVDILEGKRFIHSHSYRQDEILMLMRLAARFGFRVNTFQHVLEGYKVADELAAHGASASSFSDWWAYKYEVIDAIPWNGYVMWDRGVNVSYNSDSDELARRLSAETAKAVKYGGVPPAEAIKFVTINPAQQLHIDKQVGSLEVGKEADFAIWSGSPISPQSYCEQTWIQGRKYFDRAEDLAARPALATERAALVAHARAAAKPDSSAGSGLGGRRWPPRYLAETNMSGNACGENDDMPFASEALVKSWQAGEVVR